MRVVITAINRVIEQLPPTMFLVDESHPPF